MDDEDKEWKELQKSVKKDKEKEGLVESHPVHAPYFPAVNQNNVVFFSNVHCTKLNIVICTCTCI